MITLIVIQSIAIWILLGYYCTKRLNRNGAIWALYAFAPLIFLVIFFHCLFVSGLRNLFNNNSLNI